MLNRTLTRRCFIQQYYKSLLLAGGSVSSYKEQQYYKSHKPSGCQQVIYTVSRWLSTRVPSKVAVRTINGESKLGEKDTRLTITLHPFFRLQWMNQLFLHQQEHNLFACSVKVNKCFIEINKHLYTSIVHAITDTPSIIFSSSVFAFLSFHLFYPHYVRMHAQRLHS